jgi:hypothetical protein
VFVGDPLAVALAHCIDLADQPPGVAAHFKRTIFRRLVVKRKPLQVQPPAGIDIGIGDANLFNLFEIEQPLAIEQRVQRHHAQRR